MGVVCVNIRNVVGKDGLSGPGAVYLFFYISDSLVNVKTDILYIMLIMYCWVFQAFFAYFMRMCERLCRALCSCLVQFERFSRRLSRPLWLMW